MLILYTKPITDRKRGGTILVLAAFCLIIVLAFLAFAIDFGYIVTTESELQKAADAGALSGVRALSDSREAAIAAALEWAGKNIVAGEQTSLVAEEDIEIGFWDDDLATFTIIPEGSAVVPNAVKVTCRRDSSRGTSLPLFFASFLGTDSVNLAASCIAQNKGGSCGGIMALVKIYLNDRQVGRASYTDSYDSNKGAYGAASAGDNGDICTNGHLTLNGNSYVNGDARWWEESNSPNADESQVSGELTSFVKQIEFPEIDLGDAATVNNNNLLGNSDNGVPLLVDGKFQLGSVTSSGGGGKKKKEKGKKGKKGKDSGGSTGGSEETPDSVTLPPGTYYFSEMAVGSNSIITVTGPTYIYVEGQIDLRYGAIDNTTKIPVNLQIYPMGEDTYFYLPFFGELHASIYSTKAHIYLDEKNEPVNFNFYGKMVGQKIRVWDTALHVDESISFGALESGGEQIGTSDGASIVK